MKWIPISEKPKKDGWYLGWCPGASVDNWDPVRWFEGRWLDDTCLTHWAEVTGPEEEFCEWEYIDDEEDDSDGLYKSTCDYVLDHDEFRRYTFCPNCGRPIREIKP